MSESDDENSEYNDTIFSGLNKKERIELRNKMNGIHSNYSDAIRKERELKLTQTICSVEFNIGHNITNDFWGKHQFKINDKIFRKYTSNSKNNDKNKNKKNKKGGNDSESEFDLNEYDQFSDSDSEFSYSDWENPDFIILFYILCFMFYILILCFFMFYILYFIFYI